MNNNEDWLAHLSMLIERFSYLGIGFDTTLLTLAELWALYLFLSRLAEG